MADFIITTTNNIEYAEVQQYFDIVSTNVVIGANIFSDWAASLTDIFGGTSGSYQNQLEYITTMAKVKLTNQARELGANAILGYRIDIDEVSGGGKSMFMISAIGTAVYVQYKERTKEKQTNHNAVSRKQIEIIKQQQDIIKIIESGYAISDKSESMLERNPITDKDFIKLLCRRYSATNDTDFANWIARYLRGIMATHQDNILDVIYEFKDAELIKDCNALSPRHILSMFDKDVELSKIVAMLDAEKDFYTQEDITLLEQIIDKIEKAPNTGKLTEKKNLFGKIEEKHECECGNIYDASEIFCPKCNKKISGLTRDNERTIENTKTLIKTLKSII